MIRGRFGYHLSMSGAVQVLHDQHERITDLFDRVSSPDEDRPKVLKELLQELSAHIAVERSVLYPVVKDKDLGDAELSDHLKSYHDEIEKLLILIERRKYNSPDMPDLVTQMKDLTTAHVSEASGSLLPAMERTMSEAEKAELGTKLANADDVILTHPHPHLASTGPISRVTTRLAATFDRARDRTVDNRHGD